MKSLMKATIFALIVFGINSSKSQAAVLGDIDQNDDINLTDAILGLQIITGSSPTIPQMAAGMDVDQDGKIGLAEVVYVLVTIAGNPPVVPQALNDTGITWGANYPEGNNTDCTSNITGAQDCSQGRDATHNDDSDGHAGFSYTKLDINGNSLPASAESWSCVRDNVTNLVWEVKTDDGGIHDKDNNYRWGGKTALGSGYGTYYSDWDSLVDGSNDTGFCGYNDWRVPTIKELVGLVDYGRTFPAIDINYFPNTGSYDYFWSASPASTSSNDISYADDAWIVYTPVGDARRNVRFVGNSVRLVRSGE